MQLLDRSGLTPVQAWLAGLGAGVGVLLAGSLALTERVYYGFLWRYFWGPVKADALGTSCLVYLRESGAVVTGAAAGTCARTPVNIVAEPGYTLVSEAGYALTLVFMLSGVYLLLQRVDLRPYTTFLLALTPYFLLGGALRVVEDAFDRGLETGVGAALSYPWNTPLISPLIYFTVFFVTLAALGTGKYLDREGVTDTYYYPLAGLGAGALVVTCGYLAYLSATTDYVSFYPAVLVTVLGLSTTIAAGAYLLVRAYAPGLHRGTGVVGAVVVWAHAVDGVANVIASDWATAFGLPALYGSKHPVDRILAGVAESVPGLAAVPGDSWLFLVVKVVVAVAILAVFEEEFVEESPRYSVLLLAAIIAVGLGPGTRDMVRVTFGI